MSTHQAVYAQKRRSTRIEQAIPLVVQGVGALREPYQEQVSTLSISCHGCTYMSKHEVIQGETVYLDIKQPEADTAACSSRAQVKWAQKTGTGKERMFQIAVELEIAGNIWGVTKPPTDWFPPQLAPAADPANAARELKVVPRKEQQAIPATDSLAQRIVRPARAEQPAPAAAGVNPIAQIMVGLGEQIQTMAAEAAASALIKERGRLLDEFRTQLRDEAGKALQAAIVASKDTIVRQTMKELSETHEAGMRASHAAWRKQIEQDMEAVRQHLAVQGKEATQRLEASAIGTLERVQNKLEATRSEAVERFVARIREQVTPMLEVAKDSLQRLEGAESALRKESQAIFAEIENQLALSTNASLARAHEEMEKSTDGVIAKSNEALQKLYEGFEQTSRDGANALLASAGSQMSKLLQEKAGEVSREFSAGLETHTRSYLESIGKSIAEIPQKLPGNGNR